jgi:hypothetical protein
MAKHPNLATIRRILACGLMGMAGLLAACGGGDPPVAAVKLQALNCSALQPASTSAEPLTHIALNGASALGIDESWSVEVRSREGVAGVTTLARRDGGPLELISPIHPARQLNGGVVTLVLKNSRQICGDISFNIEAMAPANSATFSAEISPRLRTLAGLALAQFNGSLAPGALLGNSLADLPVDAIPAALLATQMTEANDIDAAWAALPDGERQFADALLERQGLAQMLDAFIQAFQPAANTAQATAQYVPATADNATQQSIPPAGLKLLQAAPAMLKARPAADSSNCRSLGSVKTSAFTLDSPKDLSDYLKVAKGLKQDYFGPIGTAHRQSVATASSALGLLGPPALGITLNWTLYTIDLIQKMRVNLYPNELTAITYELQKTSIEEDWSFSKYNDPQIRWHTAKLYATNSGMDIGRPTVDALFTAANLSVPAPGNAKLVGWMADQNWQKKLNDRLDQLDKDRPDDGLCWVIGVTEFGPVVVPDDTQAQWLEGRVTSGSLYYDHSTRELVPIDIGVSQLEIKSRVDQFPGPAVFTSKAITVPRKTIRFLPSTPLFVQTPGANTELRFRIDDAKHADLPFSSVLVTDKQGNAVAVTGHQTESDAVHVIQVQTPTDPDRFPLTVLAASTSETLFPFSPPRAGSQSIVIDQRLAIGPEGVCLARGDPQRFTAVFSGTDPAPKVSWTVVSGGGSLSAASGLDIVYTAPATDGAVTLRVSLDADPRVQAELSFQVGKCVGMAVYYTHAAEVSFPGNDVGCMSNDNRVTEQTEDTTDLIPDLLTPTPAAQFWFGRSSSINYDPVPSGTRQRGVGSNLSCSTESFAGRSTLASTLQASDAGNRLDVAIAASASNTCTFSAASGQEECSSSLTNTGWLTRHEIELKTAASYRVQVSMACTRDLPLPESFQPYNVSISVYRFGADGAVKMTHTNLAQAFLPPTRNFRCVDAVSSVSFDQTVVFDAPATPGQSERAVVVVFGGNGAAALDTSARGTNGLSDSGSMNGFVEVTRVTP